MRAVRVVPAWENEMNAVIRGERRPIVWALALILMLGNALGAVGPLPARAAQQPSGREALDLPYMAFTPADLEEADQAGYTYSSARAVGHDAEGSLAYQIGRWTEQVTDEALRATLEEAGHGRSYQFWLRLRQDIEDPRSDLARDVNGAVYEFTDEDGAAAALDLIDELTADSELVERVEGDDPVGDESIPLRVVKDADAETAELALVFRVDRLVALVRILNYSRDEPAVTEIEPMGARLQDRIERVLAGDAPGLGNRVLRLTSDEFNSLYEVRRDQYLRLDGEDIPLDLVEAAELAAQAKPAGDAIDVYGLNQFLRGVETDPPVPGQFNWGIRLYAFADDAAASDWLAAKPDLIAEEAAAQGADVSDIEPLEDLPDLGDEQIGFTYVEDDGTAGGVTRAFVRSGAVVADVRLSALDFEPPLEAFMALLTGQVACLENGCPEPVTISDALAGRVGGGERPGARLGAGGPLDLARITLTPTDLDAAEMPDFGVAFGQTQFPDELISSTAANRGLDEDEVAAAVGDAGFIRRYDSYLYHLQDPNDPNSLADRLVVSYVLEFGDEAGAAAAFSYLEDESWSDTARDLRNAPEFGDESEVTSDAGEDARTGERYAQLDLTARAGNLHAGVAIVDWTGEEPDPAELEALGGLLMERIAAAQEEGAPALGVQVPRLTGDGITPSADSYLISNGAVVPLSGETNRDARSRENAATDAGQTDVYRLWQQLYTGTDEAADDVWYLVELSRFADEDAAAAWVAGIERAIETNESYENARTGREEDSGADELLTYRYTNGDARFRGFALRIGAEVAVVDVAGPRTPPSRALDALLEAQIACIAESGCVAPLPLPDDLVDFLADVESGATHGPQLPQIPRLPGSDADEEQPASGDGETYVSPAGDYAVTWDPGEWVRTSGDGDEGVAFHIMGSVIVMATIHGVEAFDGDPEACVTGLAETSSGDTALVPAEDLPAPRTVRDAAGGVFTLGNFGVVYFECRTLVPGESVLQIRFAAPTGDYEAALPALESLLAGVSIPAETSGNVRDTGVRFAPPRSTAARPEPAV